MSFPTREQVLAAIEEHAPERLKRGLAQNLRPAIAFAARPAEDAQLGVGASKIGGAPDVPAGFEWPLWNGKPLGFVAQFNLEEAAAFDVEGVLPDAGTLSFFYDIEEQTSGYEPEERGAWRVFFWPREMGLERRDVLASSSNFLPPCALLFALR